MAKLTRLKCPLVADNLIIAKKNRYWAEVINRRRKKVAILVRTGERIWEAYSADYTRKYPIEINTDLRLSLEQLAEYFSDQVAYVRDHPKRN